MRKLMMLLINRPTLRVTAPAALAAASEAQTAALVREAGGRAETAAGDARQPETHAAVVRTAEQAFGGLDIAVNNVGALGAYKPLAELSPDEWRDTLDSNLTTAFLGARSQIPAMLRRGGGAPGAVYNWFA